MVPERFEGEFVRSYPGRAAFVPDARADIRAFAVRSRLSAAEADDVAQAVGELLTFLISNTAGHPRPFRLAAWSYPNRIEVELESEHPVFATALAAWDPDEETLAPRGLGMRVLRGLVDEIEFTDDGRVASIVKNRSAGSPRR